MHPHLHLPTTCELLTYLEIIAEKLLLVLTKCKMFFALRHVLDQWC